MSFTLSFILRTLWESPLSTKPAAYEAIIEAVETLEKDLDAARADLEKLRLLHEEWLLKSQTTRRKERG